MFTLRKRFTFEYAHALVLGYKSECVNIHGHTAKVVFNIRSNKLNKEEMVIDFKHIKKIIQPLIDNMDHSFIASQRNNVMQLPPDIKIFNIPYQNTTAEAISQHIYNSIKPKLESHMQLSIEFFETTNNSVVYGDF